MFVCDGVRMPNKTWIQQSPVKEGINRSTLSEQTVPWCWSAVNGPDVNLGADCEHHEKLHTYTAQETHYPHPQETFQLDNKTTCCS